MLPKKYHAIAFVSILVMLLLLGLHLLGFGIGGGQSASASGSRSAAAALARNSSIQIAATSSSLSPTGASSTLSSNQVYRHPIAYDKLTGATNNQINDVLGGLKSASNTNNANDYPIDHYQRQSQQPQHPLGMQNQHMDPMLGDDFFPLNQHHLHPTNGHSPFGVPVHPNSMSAARMSPPPHHPHAHHHQLHQAPPPEMHHPHQMGPPQPPHLVNHMRPQQQPSQQQPHGHLMTTQAPNQQQQQSFAANQPTSDSLPSASSLNPNDATNQQFNLTSQQQQQHPAYYTPPIFAYNNQQQQPSVDMSPMGPQQQQPQLPLAYHQPPVGVPEMPLSVDEYNARQARLRQLTNGNNNNNNQVSVSQAPPDQIQSRQQQPPPPQMNANLLYDPKAQQRHKQQMLDRQLLFGSPVLVDQQQQPASLTTPQTNVASAYYPDPAAMPPQHQQRAGQLAPPSRGAPYVQQPPLVELSQSAEQFAGNNVRQPPRAQPPANIQRQQQSPPSVANRNNTALQSQSQNHRPQTTTINESHTPAANLPTCARSQQLASTSTNEISPANSSMVQPILFCNEDPDYPTREIMRALESFAVDRSIEQILPQQLVQMLVLQQQQQQPKQANNLELQRQLVLDPLQSDLLVSPASPAKSSMAASTSAASDGQFPSANFESMCKSLVYIAQPRRAKNLSGQWKVVVNLPGHKYRGIAISQMVRIDECSRPMGECGGFSQLARSSASQLMKSSRCLQQYENQRLLSWSNQQGLHFDLFRLPSACSCHMRRA